jgi:hypothetical protein
MTKKLNLNGKYFTKDEFMDIYEKTITEMFTTNKDFRNKIMSGDINKSSLSPKIISDELWDRIK